LMSLRAVHVWGTASPDGCFTANQALANRRRNSLAEYLCESVGIPSELIVHRDGLVSWSEFRAIASEGGIPMSQHVYKIASAGNDSSRIDVSRRMSRLKALDNRRVWRVLSRDIFPRLRSGAVVVVTTREAATSPAGSGMAPVSASEPEPEPEPETSQTIIGETLTTPTSCIRGWHLSTNIPALGMAIANLSGHYDFACRWSAALSLYYSGWNYGTTTRKFRTFIIRPEVRYWMGYNHNGLFVDGHLSMVAYNYAMPSWRYRIQDADGKHPALGGGIGIGYRLSFGPARQWAVEAQLGVGLYHLRYDRFENRTNGPLVDTRSRTWGGIDNFAVSVVYNFNHIEK
ncbi:MAG: DUF3575 domain-containing protein, partial [Muribaculaceae bacterium]|nr:DUF3575 domain-containing protein [Muribaculaceae bacterium]